MAKNPVYNYFQERSQQVNPHSPIILGGAYKRSSDRYTIQPIFSYQMGKIESEKQILNTLHYWPHANDILVDSSFFSPVRMDLNRRLLLDRHVLLIRSVQDELNQLKSKKDKKTFGKMASIIFDTSGEFNRSFDCASEKWISDYEYPILKYVNLLRFRRNILLEPLRTFEEREGRRAVGKDLTRLQRQALYAGISQRTLSLAMKGGQKKKYTDESLSLESVLRPIILGRDCFVLTADRDIFNQIFQFTQVLFDDYGSFLIAQDFARNPDRYPHRHKINTTAMKPGAIAIGRVKDPDYLLPKIFRTCAVFVIDVATREFLSWVCIREIEQMLNFQSQVADGRAADGGNGLNVHMTLNTPKCQNVQAHFVLGEDQFVYDFPAQIGHIRLSRFDLFRIISDGPFTVTSDRRIWMPGRPIK